MLLFVSVTTRPTERKESEGHLGLDAGGRFSGQLVLQEFDLSDGGPRLLLLLLHLALQQQHLVLQRQRRRQRLLLLLLLVH